MNKKSGLALYEKAALARRVRAFKRASVVSGDGHRRCLLCGAQAYLKEQIRHAEQCPMLHPKPATQAKRR